MSTLYSPDTILAELDIKPVATLKTRLVKQMQGIWVTWMLNQVSAWTASKALYHHQQAIPKRVWQRRSALLQHSDRQRVVH